MSGGESYREYLFNALQSYHVAAGLLYHDPADAYGPNNQSTSTLEGWAQTADDDWFTTTAKQYTPILSAGVLCATRTPDATLTGHCLTHSAPNSRSIGFDPYEATVSRRVVSSEASVLVECDG